MTNFQAIRVSEILSVLIDDYFNEKSKIELSEKLYFAAKKNARLIAPISKELEDIKADIQAAFKKKNPFEDVDLQDAEKLESINAKFKEFVKDLTEEKDFLEKECTIVLHKVAEDEIINSIIPRGEENLLLEYIKA